jgi:hypothetical protein
MNPVSCRWSLQRCGGSVTNAIAAMLLVVGGGAWPAVAADGDAAATAPPAAAKAADAKTPVVDAAGDIARKAEIMNSPRWRRAIFELGEWLATQQIYTAAQVRQVKADFNQRVAGMSSYELEYLLDDLDAKFKVIDSPEAREARAWVGQYLSVMSDQKRAEVLREMPDVVTMSAAQLQQELQWIEQRRAAAGQRQADFDRSRDLLVQQAAQARQATAAAAASSVARAAPSFSPYRAGGRGGQPPFAGVKTGPSMSMFVMSGPVGIGLGGL